MKKILFLLSAILLFQCNLPVNAQQDISDADIIEGEVIQLEEENPSRILEEKVEEENALKARISEYYSFDKGLFKIRINDYFNFDFGAIGSVNWLLNRQANDLATFFKFNSADIVLSGKVNDYIDYKAQVLPHRDISERTIMGDLWVRGKYNNYTLQVGRMRKPFAHNPTLSSYNLDFIQHSQIGRLFSDHRDTGAKFVATYKYADLALGLFSSMQDRPFKFGNNGIEFDTSLTLKPLAKYSHLGDLKLIASIATGERDYSYTNYSGFVSYDYKKFGMKSEFISKEASFIDEKKANGYYIDGTYYLTDKLQALVRFDSFNPDVDKSSHRQNEYVTGLNYYLNGKNTMFSVNYSFIDGRKDSHRVGLQMRYRTW